MGGGNHKAIGHEDRIFRMDAWSVGDTEAEDLIRFDRNPSNDFFCTDGLGTHENVHVENGPAMDHMLECPKQSGVSDCRNDGALRPQVCLNLKTYRARVVAGRVRSTI